MNRWTRTRWPFALLSLVALLATGCPPSSQAPEGKSKQVTPTRPLKLLVVDDPEIAKAVGRLRAEWAALTGVGLEVSEQSEAELLSSKSLSADAVIYPAHDIGFLAERGWIAPISPQTLALPDLAWSEVFSTIQLGETHWGRETLALPFGSPIFVCFYRPDLFAKHHKTPPQTWAEYQELAEFFHDRRHAPDDRASDGAWHGTIEPVAHGWNGRLLLARAAAYARHRDNYSTLFDTSTMEPLIAGEPFVVALQELKGATRFGPVELPLADPAIARREFLAGNAAMAISWPTGAGAEESPASNAPVAFCELPGSSRAYNVRSHAWEDHAKNDIRRVPLLSIAGRQGSISEETPWPDRAGELLAWLSGRKWSTRVAAASPATTLYRADQAKAPRPWLNSGVDAEAATGYARATSNALGGQIYLYALRLPGDVEYFEALDTAVTAALAGVKEPKQALEFAAERWQAITIERGAAEQRRAYRRSLGLDE